MNLNTFFAELKRRNVYRAAVAILVFDRARPRAGGGVADAKSIAVLPFEISVTKRRTLFSLTAFRTIS